MKLVLEPTNETTIEQAVQTAIRVAGLLKIEVWFVADRVVCICKETSTVQEIVDRFRVNRNPENATFEIVGE